MMEEILPICNRLRVNTHLTGKGVTIGFLDGGFAYHPDIVTPERRVKAFYDVLRPTREFSLDIVENVSAFHGTCVVMSAIGRGKFPGLAPDADVVLVDVGRDYVLSDNAIVDGFRWFLQNHRKYDIRIVVTACNASENCLHLNDVIEDLTKEGVVVVAAAGNGLGYPEPPANAKSCITVGGYNDGGDGLEFSPYPHKFNEYKPTILAPAVNIPVPMLEGYSDKIAAEKFFFHNEGDYDALKRKRIISSDYRLIDGTSLAAPIVASAIALMLQARNDLTPSEIETILKETSNCGAICLDKILALI